MVKVTIKWGKQKFEDVELVTTEPPTEFMSKVLSLTGVPVARQKIMAKGAWKGMLKENDDLSKYTIKEGAQIMLMGTAEVAVAPVQKTVFMEDMSAADVVQAGAVLPAGLRNLGNTCYMNSTMQCLRVVPELMEALKGYNSTGGGADGSQSFTLALRDAYRQLDSSIEPVAPMMFVQMLRQLFPQFAEQGPRGGYKQQDADELLMTLTSGLAQTLRNPIPQITQGGGSSSSSSTATSGQWSPRPLASLGGASSVIDALFGLEMEQTMTCLESDMETAVTSKDKQTKLVCNIQGGAGSQVQVNHLSEGIMLGLEGDVEKHSDVLGRNALFRKQLRINRLPRYVCIQFMRFYWKATPESRDHAGVKCKMMRPVSFPATLDLFEMCSDDLKASLKVHRDRHADKILNEFQEKEAKKQKLEAGETEAKTEDGAAAADAAGAAAGAAMEEEGGDDEEQKALAEAMALSMAGETRSAGVGLPDDFMGQYELFAVVTHKGRSADSGHYMGWSRQQGDDWLCFDDDEVSECKTEDIMKLKGGGDWHMAYLTFYRYKQESA